MQRPWQVFKGVQNMKDKVRVLPDYQYNNRITIAFDLLPIEYQHLKMIFVRFGKKCIEVKVETSYETPTNEILLSVNVIQEFHLPLQPYYEIQINKNELELGPFIGILAAKTKDKLDETVDVLTNYVYDYEEISGAILAFSVEGVNMDEQLIEGYVYNPDQKAWDFGVFHYPSSIFKRTSMEREMSNHFHSALGSSIFNSYKFNKWELFKWLKSFPSISQYLPETVLYERARDVIWFLKTYERALIKPIFGSKGIGIIQAVRNGNKLTFSYTKEGEVYEEVFEKEEEARNFIRRFVKRNRAIIQQKLELLRKDESVIDFRLLLVKNELGRWQDFGLVGRIGKSGSFISNISSGGSALIGEDVLKEVIHLPEDQLFQFRQKLSSIAFEVAANLEKCGIHLGNLGIDFAIDQDLNVFIIEVNNKDPNHTIAIDANDRQMFYHVKRANMLYAKYLTGFGKE